MKGKTLLVCCKRISDNHTIETRENSRGWRIERGNCDISNITITNGRGKSLRGLDFLREIKSRLGCCRPAFLWCSRRIDCLLFESKRGTRKVLRRKTRRKACWKMHKQRRNLWSKEYAWRSSRSGWKLFPGNGYDNSELQERHYKFCFTKQIIKDKNDKIR